MTAFSPAVAGSRTAEPWVDNLRVVVISGVIVGHTATAYVVDFPWYYDDERATSGVWTTLLSFPTVAGAIFWLGPLFLVAGWFSVRSLDRSGAAAFARSRLLRLGLPLAGYVAVVQPLTDYVGNLRGEQGSFVTYLRATEVGPMWFLAALLTFSLAYAGLRGAAHRGGLPRRVAGVAMDAEMVLNLRVGEWPQGAVLFALGVRAGEAGWLADLTGRRGRRLGCSRAPAGRRCSSRSSTAWWRSPSRCGSSRGSAAGGHGTGRWSAGPVAPRTRPMSCTRSS